MKIAFIDQLKKNSTYYYTLYSNPKLEHQGDGVSIYSCIYQNCSKEREEKYGVAPGAEYVLKTNEQIVFAGRNNDNYNALGTYMMTDWLRSRNFYTTLEEAQFESIHMTFEKYEPYKEKDE